MDDNWHWQDYGHAWRGVGIYHMVLVAPNRAPLFGSLNLPSDDPLEATIDRTDFGNAIVDELLHIYTHYPQIRILQFCLMPNHLHAIIHVTAPLPVGIIKVARGYLQGVKRIERNLLPDLAADTSRQWDKPYLRPMSTHNQLQSMIRYVQMNPARLATKRLKPGFFCVQHNVDINGRMYDAVGNIFILSEEHRQPVHVRSMWVKDAEEHGNTQPLRDYMNGCVLAARNGTVMVSPYISEYEKDILNVLLKENRFVILLADNGFGKFFKPSDALFDAVAKGRLLILSPWQHDPDKRHITRPECVALNGFAEEICSASK